MIKHNFFYKTLFTFSIAPYLLFAQTNLPSRTSPNQESQPGKMMQNTSPTKPMEPPSKKITVVLNPTSGNKAKGEVSFSQEKDGVRVTGHFTDLTPGEHGIHIHEKPDCSAPDASSAGDHLNPTQAKHGGPDSSEHHMGDLGNITADSSGKANMNQVFKFISLEGPNSILQHALVVHSGKDDLTTQPAGDSKGRVACGVIR